MLLPMSIRMLINPSRSSSLPRLPNEVPISRLHSLYLSNPLRMLHFEVPNHLPARLAQNPVIISRSVSVIAPNEHPGLRLLYRRARAGCRSGRAALRSSADHRMLRPASARLRLSSWTEAPAEAEAEGDG